MKGQNFRIFIGSTTTLKPVAAATSCTVHLSTTLEDSSTKDTSGNFTSQDVTGVAWDISCDALFSVEADSGAQTGADLLSLLLAQEEVYVSFDITSASSDKNRTSSSTLYSGKAWINDISVSAPNRQNTTYSIQLTGNGTLSAGAPSAT